MGMYYRLFSLWKEGRSLKKYFSANKGIFGASVFVTFCSSCLDIGIAFVLQFIINASTTGNINKLLRVGLGCLIFMIVYAAVKCFNTVLVRKCIKNFLIQIKQDLFINLISNETKKLKDNNIAEYISNITNDINILEKEYLESIFSLLTIVFNFILGCISITFLNVNLAILSIGIGIIVLFVPILFGKKLNVLKEEYSKSLSVFTVKVKDIFSGVDLIKSYNLQKKVINEFNGSNAKVEDSKYKTYKFNAYLSAVSSAINYFTICFILVIVGIQVIEGNLTIGAAIAAMQLLDYIINPINTIGIYINKVKTNTSIINKLVQENQIKKQNGIEVIDNFRNKICLEDVSYSYNENNDVIKKISFTFEKNKKYIIVGNSGGGKSTLLGLINGSLEGFSGSITIDGKKIEEIDSRSLNRLISIIHQNIFLFDDTIRNNITLFDDTISEECLKKVIRTVGLENLINKKGIDGKVGENGEFLSGGEKQRIAIARALVKKTKILLLDEATAALDLDNSFNIENMILQIPDLTLIVVSHKFIKENLDKYDNILAIKDGQLKEFGTFQKLIDRKGYFYSLFSIIYGDDQNDNYC